MGTLVVIDESLGEVDTSPPGADPDVDVSFEPGQADDRDEVGDPHRFLDEPFDVDDPEGDLPRDDEFVDFGTVTLEDTTSHERWLQSALKALVEPALAVDGALGTRTRAATKAFQRRVREFVPGAPRLAVDGIAGPQTIAALEAATGSAAPATREDEREEPCPEGLESEDSPDVAAPGEPTLGEPTPDEPTPTPTVAAGGGLSVVERTDGDGTEYVIASGDDSVSFRYWTPEWKNYKPYNVSRYKGARRNLLSDAQITAAGYSASELAILKANAMKESGGAFGAINTWDNQIVSWGMAQFAGHAGTLAALMAELKEDPRSAPSFARWFVANGVDVAYGTYPYKDRTATGWHVVVQGPDAVHTGDDGWRYVRTQPRLVGAFLLAGNDPAIALGQVLFWRRSFLSRAIRKVIGKGKGKGAPVSKFLTAERSLAVIVRLYNWMPAYVVKWCDRFLAELASEHPGVDVYDPGTFDVVPALETELVEKICAERKRVKSGSYDTYALDLGRERGSFVSGAEPRRKSAT